MAITQPDPATLIPSVTEPSAGAVTPTNTDSGPSSSSPDAPQQRHVMIDIIFSRLSMLTTDVDHSKHAGDVLFLI